MIASWLVPSLITLLLVVGAAYWLFERRYRRLIDNLYTQATTDGLTGLYNHICFQMRLREEVGRVKRYRRPMALLMIDVDGFKPFNDRFGHPAGDEALRMVAQSIRVTLRRVDLPARYGGEEFAVILPETPQAGAMVAAERVRQRIEALVGLAPLTVSIGVSTYDGAEQGAAASDVIRWADAALYAAKASGKNAVRLHSV